MEPRSRKPQLTIAVDFDGTIVEHKYPEIGREVPFAFNVLREFDQLGFRLILWTFRHGRYLEEAVVYCQKNGLQFYAVNANHPDSPLNLERESPKILADIYIDDRNVGGFLGWAKIREAVLGNPLEPPKKGGLFSWKR